MKNIKYKAIFVPEELHAKIKTIASRERKSMIALLQTVFSSIKK